MSVESEERKNKGNRKEWKEAKSGRKKREAG